MSSWHSTDNYKSHLPLSLPPSLILPLQRHGDVFVLLLPGSPNFLAGLAVHPRSTLSHGPGSDDVIRCRFFHYHYLLAIKRDGFDVRQTSPPDAVSASSLSNINQCDLGPGQRHVVDTSYRRLCQTPVAESRVCPDTCGNVYCWANATLLRFGL